MSTKEELLKRLKKELEFLESGGYRDPDLWRAPRIFEDSGTCSYPYGRRTACSSDCPLLTFVPVGRRKDNFPCRHIPLNADGYTLESMYHNNSHQEIEDAVRTWLLETIAKITTEQESTTEQSAYSRSA